MRVFTETQKFDQWWLRGLIVLVLAISFIPILFQSTDAQTMPKEAWVVAILAVVIAVLMAVVILFVVQLRTKIDEQGVSYKFYPFHINLRIIPWNEIKEINTRTYSPIGEYGGWGFRGGIFRKNNVAFNVKGKLGIQLELVNSKRILLGTQKQSEANAVIKYYTNKSDEYDSL